MHWNRLLPLLLLAVTALLMTEEAQADTAEIPLYLVESTIGSTAKMSPEHPDADSTLQRERVHDGLNQGGNYYPVAKWEMMLGGDTHFANSYDFQVSVWSTNTQEFNVRAALYLIIEGDSYEVANDTAGETGSFPNWLSGHYNISATGNSISMSNLPAEYRDRLPMGTKVGFKLESSVTWAPDTDNRTAYVEWDHEELDSHIIVDIQHIFFDPQVFFNNERVDEAGEDSLYMKANLSNSLGVDDFDTESLQISIGGVPGGGDFRGSAMLKDRHTYAKYAEGRWYYQDDDAVASEYAITFAIRDIRGAEWTETVYFDLVVDYFEIELEAESDTELQLPRGGRVEFTVKLWNRGNARDNFTIEVDEDPLPNDWSATLLTDEDIGLEIGDYDYARMRIDASETAEGGQRGHAILVVTSQNDGDVSETLSFAATVRTYGVTIKPFADEVAVDPEELDAEGQVHIPVSVRNTGNDKDTYNVQTSVGRGDWATRIEDAGNPVTTVTVASGITKSLMIVIKPVNFEIGDDTELFFQASSQPPGNGEAAQNTTLVIKIPLSKLVNLVVTEDDLQMNPAQPVMGDDVQLMLHIENEGGKPADTFKVRLFVGSGGAVEYETEVEGVGRYDSVDVPLYWEDVSPGNQELLIHINYNRQVEESDDTDNKIRLTVNVTDPSSNGNGNGDDDDDDALPGFGLALLAPAVAVAARRRKR